MNVIKTGIFHCWIGVIQAPVYVEFRVSLLLLTLVVVLIVLALCKTNAAAPATHVKFVILLNPVILLI